MRKYLLLLLVLISTVFNNCTPVYDNPNDYKGDKYINRKGITIDDTSFIITEGESTTIDISLASIPLFDVEVDFSGSITTELSISPVSLTFTRENYMNARSVTISHLDNFLVTGAAYFEVNPVILSSDPDYNTMDFPTVNIVVSDEDLAPVAVPVTPYDGQFLVSPFQQVAVKFSKDMNPDTINNSTFTVEGSSGPVSGYIFYYPRKKMAVFQCRGVLQYKHDYTVTIKSTVEDSAGNQMAADSTFSYKTKDFEPERIGGLATTDARDVVVSGDFAYVADNASGLRIINVSNPSVPSQAGIYDTTLARGVYLQGNYAYVADYGDGLRIINISNPYAPSYGGAWDLNGNLYFSHDVYVSGDYAFVAHGGGEIQGIDINPPGSAWAAKYYAPYISIETVTGAGNHLYTNAGSSIGIADISPTAISSPSWPTGYTSSVATADWCNELYADGNFLYSCGSEGVEIFDRLSPMSPVSLATCPTDNAEGVYAAYGYAFIADSTDIEIFDLSEPNAPVRAGTVGSYSNAYRTYVSNYYLYLAAGTAGLEIYDLEPVKKMSSYESYLEFGKSSYEIKKGEFDVFINGSYAFITGSIEESHIWKGTLSIIDLSNPAGPVSVGIFDDGYAATDHWFSSVHVSGDYAYIAYCNLNFIEGYIPERIAGSGGLLIVDISDPANPVARGYCATGGTAEDVFVSGSYAYVADGANGLRVVNISNPDTPDPVGIYNTTGIASGITAAGSFAFVSDGTNGLQVLDISSPASPVLPAGGTNGWFNTGGTANAAVYSGGYVYIADGANGLLILNAWIPAGPYLVGTCDTGGSAEGIHVDGSFAYIADGNGGFAVIDVSNPESPSLKRTIALAGDSYNLSKHGSHVYVSDKEGLQILHVGPFQ